MLERLKMMDDRYQELQEMLQNPDVVSDVKKMTALMKEMRQLEKTVNLYHKYLKVLKQRDDAKELIKDGDEEMKELAEMELSEAESSIPEIEEELKILLIPRDPNDEKNVIMEIRGAAGGDEANIFAGDLFRMYSKYL